MRRMLSALCVVAAIAATTAPVLTVTNGQPDANRHPYVGVAIQPIPSLPGYVFVCSGAALSPTTFLTAAHCFDPSQPAFVSYKEGPPFGATFTPGTFTTHPDWCIGCGPGLPGFDFHDVAVIELAAPSNPGAFATLPTPGLVDTLAMRTSVDIVGYGVQGFVRGGGQPSQIFTFTPLLRTKRTGSEQQRCERRVHQADRESGPRQGRALLRRLRRARHPRRNGHCPRREFVRDQRQLRGRDVLEPRRPAGHLVVHQGASQRRPDSARVVTGPRHYSHRVEDESGNVTGVLGTYTKKFGRGDWIRTSDPLRPRQVRYQAALRPDSRRIAVRLKADTTAARHLKADLHRLYYRGWSVRLNTDVPSMSRKSTVISSLCAAMFTSPKN